MVRCLLWGMEVVSEKVVNFDKLQEITQLADENPAIFLKSFTRDHGPVYQARSSSPVGATVLATHFIFQSAPDI